MPNGNDRLGRGRDGCDQLAAAPPTLCIGVLTNLAGSTADSAGQGSVVAARLVAEDADGAVHGARIEVLAGNSQAKPDIARQWFDQEAVAAIVDLPYSNRRTGRGEGLDGHHVQHV